MQAKTVAAEMFYPLAHRCLRSEEASNLPQVKWAAPLEMVFWMLIQLSPNTVVLLQFKHSKSWKKIILIRQICIIFSNCKCFKRTTSHPPKPRTRASWCYKVKRKSSQSSRFTWGVLLGHATLMVYLITSPKTSPRRTSKLKQEERS